MQSTNELHVTVPLFWSISHITTKYAHEAQPREHSSRTFVHVWNDLVRFLAEKQFSLTRVTNNCTSGKSCFFLRSTRCIRKVWSFLFTYEGHSGMTALATNFLPSWSNEQFYQFTFDGFFFRLAVKICRFVFFRTEVVVIVVVVVVVVVFFVFRRMDLLTHARGLTAVLAEPVLPIFFT